MSRPFVVRRVGDAHAVASFDGENDVLYVRRRDGMSCRFDRADGVVWVLDDRGDPCGAIVLDFVRTRWCLGADPGPVISIISERLGLRTGWLDVALAILLGRRDDNIYRTDPESLTR